MKKFVAIWTLFLIAFAVCGQGNKKIITDYSGRIKTLSSVNSMYQDFSLVVDGSSAYFASNRETSLVNYRENNWSKSNKINVYKAEISQLDDYYEVNVSDLKPMLELKDEFTHVGPICFSATGDTMFFTKVPKKLYDKSIKILKPQLYMLVKTDNKKWGKTPQILPFNNPLYVFAHPSYNSSTNTLYFVSDLKGGEGGKDIYSVSHDNGKWEKPKNLKYVNSKKDEVFPFMDKDQTLFFSSNRKESMGGLDVFYSEGPKGEPENLRFVNSQADDFGIFLVKGTNIGFLSSNRNGNDDIYTITINKEKNLRNSLFGKFQYRKLKEAIEAPMTVYLLNERKEPVQEALINENGEFEFFDIGLSEEYTIQAESKAEMELVLYDSEGNPDEKLLSDEYNEFVYKMIDIKDVGDLNLTQINEKGETLIAGRFLYEDNPTAETGALTVNLIDPNGTIAHTIVSDKKGFFDFTNLPNDKDYIVKLEEENSDLTLIIFNNDGKIVERLKDDGTGLYLFKQLKVLMISNVGQKKYLREDAFSFDSGIINGDFDKNGEDVIFDKDLLISVYNDKGVIVDTIKADSKGVFSYTKIPGTEDYSFKLDQMGDDYDITGLTMKILDEKGYLIKEIHPQSNGTFQYRSLEILNIQALQARNSLDETDFDLMSSDFETSGKIKYNNEDILVPGGLEVSVYNKDNKLQEKQRTDQFGNFKFKDIASIKEYNLEITQKPESMKEELFSIDLLAKDNEPITILPSANGGFKYRKLSTIDNSANLASLNILEESIDLIYSIKGNYDYDNKEGNFDEKLKVFAFDGNGNKIGEVFSDRLGNFTFNKLPGISTVLFKIEGVSEDFDLEKFSLYIEGEDGRQLAKLRSGEKGFFVYKPLGFASEIPLELAEQLNDQVQHDVFGTNALDLSNAIESVYFGSNKTNPNSSDILKIEKMLLLLEISPNSTIEINAYADSRSSDTYNLILSEKRALWLKNYLIRKGINANRIIINAYGEGKLVNDCKDGVDCPDQDHALNRRAEIRIIN